MKKYDNLESFMQDVESSFDLYLYCTNRKKIEIGCNNYNQLNKCLEYNSNFQNAVKDKNLITEMIKKNTQKEAYKFNLIKELMRILNKTELTTQDFQFIFYNCGEVFDAYKTGGVFEQSKPNLNLKTEEI